MQTDMHFNMIYFIARVIGFLPKAAKKIAYASQHVDFAECNNLIHTVKFHVDMVGTSHRPLDFKKLRKTKNRFRPWLPFHFLPSGKNLRCEMNGTLIQPMLEYVLLHKDDPYFLHLVGIVLHVLCDSYSHWGFVGQNDESNKINNRSLKILETPKSITKFFWKELSIFKEKIKGSIAERVPVGHCAIGSMADIPYLHFKYTTEDGREVSRDNPKNFIEAARKVYEFLIRVLAEKSTCGEIKKNQTWADIMPTVGDLIRQKGSLEKRVNRWQETIKSGKYFVVKNTDRRLRYIPQSWRHEELVQQINNGKPPDACHPLLFNQAAHFYERFILKQLREEGLILS